MTANIIDEPCSERIGQRLNILHLSKSDIHYSCMDRIKRLIADKQ